MDALHAILVAIIQGATELFPVSSLGHAVVIPALFHWRVDQHAPSFLPFLVLLHAGTSVALLVYFWRDWWAMAAGVLGLSGAMETRSSRRLLVRIVVATIPAVVFGFAFNKFFRELFDNPLIACAFLVMNGLLLAFGEKLRGRGGNRGLDDLTIADSLQIGFWQCTALFPGISRSGATIVGGLLRGVDHEGAAHFSFLIALPVIVGATVLEVPKLLRAPLAPGELNLAVLAAVVAGVTAFLSTWFLMRYFRDNDKWALAPFAIYCVVFGAGALVWLGLAG
jgi:undecaprenyl-diphosphatase